MDREILRKAAAISPGRRPGELLPVRLRSPPRLPGEAALRAASRSSVELLRVVQPAVVGSLPRRCVARERGLRHPCRVAADLRRPAVTGSSATPALSLPQTSARVDGRVRPGRSAQPPEVAPGPGRHRRRRRSSATVTSPRSVPISAGSRTSPSSRAGTGSSSSPGSRTSTTRAWPAGRWANARPPTSSSTAVDGARPPRARRRAGPPRRPRQPIHLARVLEPARGLAGPRVLRLDRRTAATTPRWNRPGPRSSGRSATSGDPGKITRSQLRTILFEYIEVFYNRQRHQARLGHRTPAEAYAASRAA